MIETKMVQQVQASIANGETCIVNLTATWCPDCTEQAENLAQFADAFAEKSVPCYTLAVQVEKRVYLSDEHESFTESVGGHGFPRTVLVINGEIVDADNVEVISKEQLTELADKFVAQL